MVMNKVLKLIIVALLLVAFGQVKADDNQLKQAADLYAAQSYEKAAGVYANMLTTKGISPELYYNYANACYKSGELSLAILNYERALVLRPNYEDARFNLDFANAQISDKIEPIEPFFLTQWIEVLGSLQTTNQWGVTSIITFILGLTLALLYVFASHRLLRKLGFFGALLCVGLSVVSMAYSFSSKQRAEERSEAIVMVGAMPVKSAPDESGTELFVLHEGTKVCIKSQLRGWFEIRIADGHVGWVKASQIERI